MKKVIVRTREDELTDLMYKFGHNCALQFIDSVERKQYGDDWDSCSYSTSTHKMSCWVQLSKSGTISACVLNRE